MLLDVNKITAHYGPSQALFGVDLQIRAGEVVALMGRNGMGKSTTIKTICKLIHHSAGKIRFDEKDVSRMKSHQVSQLGIGLVPEGRRCFPNLTVRENLEVAARKGHWSYSRVFELFPRLNERSDQFANTLSGGEQQMLAIGRALTTNPKLLILDEATEGLAPLVRQEIWGALSKLKNSGLSTLIVDKSLQEILKLADLCVVLEKGSNVWTGPPNKLNRQLQDRYLGV